MSGASYAVLLALRAQSWLDRPVATSDCADEVTFWRMMSGDATVASQAGKGSVFTVRLPASAAT